MKAFTMAGVRVSERQAEARFVEWALAEPGCCETTKGAEQVFANALQGDPQAVHLVQRSGVAIEPMHQWELTIWEKAEHWRFYETVRAVSKQDVRAQFVRAYGRGYRLLGVHCVR